MGFRFRLGPFTFGRSGTRLSIWGRRNGMSVPISGAGRSFGKVGFGPFRWFFRGPPAEPPNVPTAVSRADVQAGPPVPSSVENGAIKALRSDRQFLEKLQRYGVPWRGVQERIKAEIPNTVSDRDQVAYGLVPKVMDAVVGQQETAWKTERRPSKSGSGHTTWIVIIKTSA